MLQNPSKYHHPNALSHFLALRQQSQAVQANPLQTFHAGLPTVNTIAEPQYYIQNQEQHEQRHQRHQHQQHHDQQQQQQEQSNQQQSQHVIMGNNYHSHSQKHFAQNQLDLMDGNTSIDAGKSFTIAAILGLQKNAAAVVAAEHNTRGDYNSVINLSLNHSNNNNNNNTNNNNADSNVNDNRDGSSNQMAYNRMKSGDNSFTNDTGSDEIHRNLNNMNTISVDTPTSAALTSSDLQTYNCDSMNNISRFLPAPNKSSSRAATSFGGLPGVVLNPHDKSSTTAQIRVNSFAAAAAAAAAAVNIGSGASSALQSLQQLHQQHHAQQTNLSFQRDRQKREDNSSKKSSLKNKRVRTIFTPEQLERLESEFERQQYMVGPERLYLAHTLQLTEAQVKVWFQNRRIKWRKHHLEITQQRLAMLRQSHLAVTPAPHRISATTTPTQCSDDMEDVKNNEISIGDVACESRQASESDLSICNDSNDNESYADTEET